MNQGQVETTVVEGGFTRHLEKTVTWKLSNFGEIFLLNTTNNLRSLSTQQSKVKVDAFSNYPSTTWKVSLDYGLNRRGKNGFVDRKELQAYDRGEFRGHWPIFIKYEMVPPAANNTVDFDGLYVTMETSLMLDGNVFWRFPNTELSSVRAPRPRTILITELPLCSISNRHHMLRVAADSSLTFRIKFVFFESNFRRAETMRAAQLRGKAIEDAMIKKSFRDFKNGLIEDDQTKIAIIAKDGERFTIHKSLLTSRSKVFKAMLTNNWLEDHRNAIEINFVAKATQWILHFLSSGKVNPFPFEAADAGPEELSLLHDLINFACMYEFDDLKSFLECQLPILCSQNPEIAIDLNELAKKFSMDDAKLKIQQFIVNRYDLVQQLLNV